MKNLLRGLYAWFLLVGILFGPLAALWLLTNPSTFWQRAFVFVLSLGWPCCAAALICWFGDLLKNKDKIAMTFRSADKEFKKGMKDLG